MERELEEFSIVQLVAELRSRDCAVVCFVPVELRGADPDHLEDRLIEIGWDVIDALATDPEVSPSDEDWNWAIK